MADIHLSTGGSNTAPYDTWAKAATTFATAVGAMTAGDRLLIDSAFTESAASFVLSVPSSAAAPSFILSGTPDTVSGITALAAGATLTATTTTSIVLNGWVYVYGVDFVTSSTSSHEQHYCRNNGNHMTFANCNFRITGNSNTSRVIFGTTTAATGTRCTLSGCGFRFAASGQRVWSNGNLQIDGGAWLSGGTSPVAVFLLAEGDRGSNLKVTGFDFSNLSSSVNIVSSINGCVVIAEFDRCKTPASWSGAVYTGTPRAGQVVRWTHGDNADTNYEFIEYRYAGTNTQETTIVRTGGASDGTTPIAVKMVSNANAGFPTNPLLAEVGAIWVDSVGSAKTVTVEIVHDSVTALDNDDIALEVEYLGTSGFPIASITGNDRAILASAAAHASSSATWTTTGLTNPNKQKLEVTVTPQEKGWFMPTVKLYKPSYTVYVCPQTDVS